MKTILRWEDYPGLFGGPARIVQVLVRGGQGQRREKMPAHDVTVNGSFSVNSYSLEYIVDGEVYKTITLEFGTAITPEAEPTKEGYTFSGWSEIPETMPA